MAVMAAAFAMRYMAFSFEDRERDLFNDRGHPRKCGDTRSAAQPLGRLRQPLQ
jgi:hypothetical protein